MPKRELNKSQDEAIHFTEGALELLAGPGSGKTFVITHRIQFLISNLGISPEKILVITFTKAAALEMQKRFIALSGDNKSNLVTFGTFHAIFYQILRSLPIYRSIQLISENNRVNLLDQILSQIHKENYIEDFSYADIFKQISRYKNDPEAEYDFSTDILEPEEFKELLNAYQDMLKHMNLLDFDDMVSLCFRALKENKNLLEYWQNRFDYVLIDEFQDINLLQYEVIRLLTKKKGNIFVVGDDDQSIYGFRGARPDIMKRFLEDYHAKQLFLNVNYRCSKTITEAAAEVIKENKNRFGKQIRANNTSDEKVVIQLRRTKAETDRSLVETVKMLFEEGLKWEQIAVLMRTNRELRDAAMLLYKAEIPCKGAALESGFLTNTYVKSILAYMKFAGGDYSRKMFFQFMNRPVRYIKRDALASEIVNKSTLLMYYKGDIRMQDNIALLFKHLDRISSLKPYMAIHYIRHVIGLDKELRKDLPAKEYAQYLQAAEELSYYAKMQDETSEFLEQLENIPKEKKTKTEIQGVNLCTYHASKGLEFDVVILPELIEGKVPPKQASGIDAIEEERRMFYVAMTRAKKKLYLFTYENEKEVSSRFIKPFLTSEKHISYIAVNNN